MRFSYVTYVGMLEKGCLSKSPNGKHIKVELPINLAGDSEIKRFRENQIIPDI